MYRNFASFTVSVLNLCPGTKVNGSSSDCEMKLLESVYDKDVLIDSNNRYFQYRVVKSSSLSIISLFLNFNPKNPIRLISVKGAPPTVFCSGYKNLSFFLSDVLAS